MYLYSQKEDDKENEENDEDWKTPEEMNPYYVRFD